MNKIIIKCDYCNENILRYPSRVKEHNFCSRGCLGKYSSKENNPNGYVYKDFSKNSNRMKLINAELNPTRMTDETRRKLRESRLNSGEGKSYEKTYGRHTHRIVAEQLLGRQLLPGEVVHHIDENKRNNTPENLMVFASQKAHAAWHAKQREVMPL